MVFSLLDDLLSLWEEEVLKDTGSREENCLGRSKSYPWRSQEESAATRALLHVILEDTKLLHGCIPAREHQAWCDGAKAVILRTYRTESSPWATLGKVH